VVQLLINVYLNSLVDNRQVHSMLIALDALVS
jgi:hypothetical protein